MTLTEFAQVYMARQNSPEAHEQATVEMTKESNQKRIRFLESLQGILLRLLKANTMTLPEYRTLVRTFVLYSFTPSNPGDSQEEINDFSAWADNYLVEGLLKYQEQNKILMDRLELLTKMETLILFVKQVYERFSRVVPPGEEREGIVIFEMPYEHYKIFMHEASQLIT